MISSLPIDLDNILFQRCVKNWFAIAEIEHKLSVIDQKEEIA
jgi:hypothetical protein